MIGTADHVRDLEVDVVDRARELVGGRPVRPQQCHATEPERAFRVRLADLMGGLAVADEAAALVHRAFVPAHADPLEVSGDRAGAVVDVARRVGVVDPEQHRAATLVGEAAVGDGAQRVAEME